MKKNVLLIVMIVILVLAAVANVVDIVNSIKNATTINWAPYIACYASLTVCFAEIGKKKKTEE